MRNKAASVLHHISRYHNIKGIFEFLILEIKKEKSNHLKSIFIGFLQGLSYKNSHIDYLFELTDKRDLQIKWSSYNALKSIKNKKIEQLVLEKLKIEKNNRVIQLAIGALTLNGTKASISPLINIYKKSRDGSIRAIIISVLEHIINRENLSLKEIQSMRIFSKNSNLGFEHIWKGKPQLIKKEEILNQANEQLDKNKLNVEFVIDENFKGNVYISKMKKDYIRFFTYSISSTDPSIFFNDKKISAFGSGNSINYINFLVQTKTMKPRDFKDQILEKVEQIAIPFIFDIHLNCCKFIEWSYKDFSRNKAEFLEHLKVKFDYIELRYLVQLLRYKKNRSDYREFILDCLHLWDRVKDFKDYGTREYLINELKNTAENNR